MADKVNALPSSHRQRNLWWTKVDLLGQVQLCSTVACVYNVLQMCYRLNLVVFASEV